MRNSYIVIIALAMLTACSGDDLQPPGTPQSQIMARQTRNGSLTGDDNGFVLIGRSKSQEANSGSPIGVNSYLWRATLDTLSFMPLVSADPFGGVIITDWYQDPKNPGERFKVNALILDKTLRSDGVKITVFKEFANKRGGWQEQQVDENLERSLEDTVLTRARQMRVASLSQ